METSDKSDDEKDAKTGQKPTERSQFNAERVLKELNVIETVDDPNEAGAGGGALGTNNPNQNATIRAMIRRLDAMAAELDALKKQKK